MVVGHESHAQGGPHSDVRASRYAGAFHAVRHTDALHLPFAFDSGNVPRQRAALWCQGRCLWVPCVVRFGRMGTFGPQVRDGRRQLRRPCALVMHVWHHKGGHHGLQRGSGTTKWPFWGPSAPRPPRTWGQNAPTAPRYASRAPDHALDGERRPLATPRVRAGRRPMPWILNLQLERQKSCAQRL